MKPIYGDDFKDCLANLEVVPKRCIQKNLVLNWGKFHFMVSKSIVLEHIIFERGIEVNKAKVKLIQKLQSPTSVKEIRQFLRHVGFYRTFIKEDAKFEWDER